MAFLELKNVNKSFGGVPVLKDINLSIEKGEFVAIVGFSGAGKSTLINLIVGLLRPDSGTATLNDLEITGPGPDRGIVFQNYSLLPWFTALENVRLAVEASAPQLSKADQRARAAIAHRHPTRTFTEAHRGPMVADAALWAAIFSAVE